jgi:hypothetical protein
VDHVSTYLWRGLWVIIGPRCRVGGGRGSGDDGNDRSIVGRQGLRWWLYLDPLLRSGHVVASVPLVLCSGIRSSVADISIGDCALSGRSSLGRVSIRQSIVSTCVNLGQASVGDGRISLNGLSGLDRPPPDLGIRLRLGFGSHLVEGSRVGGS